MQFFSYTQERLENSFKKNSFVSQWDNHTDISNKT